jgi:hypothetical protein
MAVSSATLASAHFTRLRLLVCQPAPALELQALFKSQNAGSSAATATEASSANQSSDTVTGSATLSLSSSSSSSSAAAASESSSTVAGLDPLESLEACRAAFQKMVAPTYFVKTPVTVHGVCGCGCGCGCGRARPSSSSSCLLLTRFDRLCLRLLIFHQVLQVLKSMTTSGSDSQGEQFLWRYKVTFNVPDANIKQTGTCDLCAWLCYQTKKKSRKTPKQCHTPSHGHPLECLF